MVKTDLDSVIGFYCPDRWEDTTGKKNAEGIEDSKDIVSGLPFLFYCLDGKIEIIEHRDDQIPSMRSDKEWMMVIGWGIYIDDEKTRKSSARAD